MSETRALPILCGGLSRKTSASRPLQAVRWDSTFLLTSNPINLKLQWAPYRAHTRFWSVRARRIAIEQAAVVSARYAAANLYRRDKSAISWRATRATYSSAAFPEQLPATSNPLASGEGASPALPSTRRENRYGGDTPSVPACFRSAGSYPH